MAIKVIGKDSKTIKTTTCGNCAAILEYTNADTKTEVRKDYTGGSDTYRTLICPECNDSVNVAMY